VPSSDQFRSGAFADQFLGAFAEIKMDRSRWRDAAAGVALHAREDEARGGTLHERSRGVEEKDRRTQEAAAVQCGPAFF